MKLKLALLGMIAFPSLSVVDALDPATEGAELTEAQRVQQAMRNSLFEAQNSERLKRIYPSVFKRADEELSRVEGTLAQLGVPTSVDLIELFAATSPLRGDSQAWANASGNAEQVEAFLERFAIIQSKLPKGAEEAAEQLKAQQHEVQNQSSQRYAAKLKELKRVNTLLSTALRLSQDGDQDQFTPMIDQLKGIMSSLTSDKLAQAEDLIKRLETRERQKNVLPGLIDRAAYEIENGTFIQRQQAIKRLSKILKWPMKWVQKKQIDQVIRALEAKQLASNADTSATAQESSSMAVPKSSKRVTFAETTTKAPELPNDQYSALKTITKAKLPDDQYNALETLATEALTSETVEEMASAIDKLYNTKKRFKLNSDQNHQLRNLYYALSNKLEPLQQKRIEELLIVAKEALIVKDTEEMFRIKHQFLMIQKTWKLTEQQSVQFGDILISLDAKLKASSRSAASNLAKDERLLTFSAAESVAQPQDEAYQQPSFTALVLDVETALRTGDVGTLNTLELRVKTFEKDGLSREQAAKVHSMLVDLQIASFEKWKASRPISEAMFQGLQSRYDFAMNQEERTYEKAKIVQKAINAFTEALHWNTAPPEQQQAIDAMLQSLEAKKATFPEDVLFGLDLL